MCSQENYIDRLAFSVNFSNCQFVFVSDLQKYDLLIFKSWNFLWGMTVISPKTQ
jgi:hypothetical protein